MAAIPYVDNIPLATDKPRDSQPDLNTNTQGVKTFVEIDHKAFADADAGKHDKVSMPRRATPTADANEAVVFCKVGAESTSSELMFTRDGGATDIVMTERGPNFTSLASGHFFKWAILTNVGPGQTVHSINAAPFSGPTATNILSAQITPKGPNPDPNFFVTIVSLGATDLTLYGSQRTAVVNAQGDCYVLALCAR